MQLFCKEDIKAVSTCASEYKLVDWVKKVNFKVWDELFLNPNAIHLIERSLGQHLEQVEKHSVWLANLCSNPNAIHIIEEITPKQPDALEWISISSNPNAIELLEEKLEKIDFNKKIPETFCMFSLLMNPGALHYIEKYDIKHYTGSFFKVLCRNPNAVHLIETILKTSHIPNTLYSNPNAIHLLDLRESEIEKNFSYLCSNPNAMDILRKKTKMCEDHWGEFCKNPNAIDIIKRLYGSHLNDSRIYQNPSIFELEKYNEKVLNILQNIN
jgi:hypothetical protein